MWRKVQLRNSSGDRGPRCEVGACSRYQLAHLSWLLSYAVLKLTSTCSFSNSPRSAYRNRTYSDARKLQHQSHIIRRLQSSP